MNTRLIDETGYIATSGNPLRTDPTGTTTQPVSAVAATARIGGVYRVGGSIIDETGTVRTVNRAFVNASGSGNTEVVAAQSAGVRIRVLAYEIVVTIGVSVKFQSATTDISPTWALLTGGGKINPEVTHGWFQTAAAEALNVNLSLGTAVGVAVIWVQAT